MQDIWYDKKLFDTDEMCILWDLLMMNAGKEVLHKISQYNNERVKYWHRWIPALTKTRYSNAYTLGAARPNCSESHCRTIAQRKFRIQFIPK